MPSPRSGSRLSICVVAEDPGAFVAFLDANGEAAEAVDGTEIVVLDASHDGSLADVLATALGEDATVLRVVPPIDEDDVITRGAGAALGEAVIVTTTSCTLPAAFVRAGVEEIERTGTADAAVGEHLGGEPPAGLLAAGRRSALHPPALDETEAGVRHALLAKRPIFVVGSPRSGTSMMAHAIRRHPDIWGGQESDHLSYLLQQLRQFHTNVYEPSVARGDLQWLSGQGVSFDELIRYLGVGLSALYASRSRGKRWVEQTPQYSLWLPELSRMFPSARFVFLVRDPRDVVHSLRNFVNPMDHGEACRTWRMFTEAGLAFRRSAAGRRLLLVRYDDLVADPAAGCAEILEFCELEPDPGPAEFIGGPRINSSFGGSGARTPGWHSWTDAELDAFQALVGDLVVTLGFEERDDWARR